MGYYSRKRNIRRFWKNPLVNLCYTLAVIAFVAGIIGVLAALGSFAGGTSGGGFLIFGIVAIAVGVLLIILGKKLNARKKKQQSE